MLRVSLTIIDEYMPVNLFCFFFLLFCSNIIGYGVMLV